MPRFWKANIQVGTNKYLVSAKPRDFRKYHLSLIPYRAGDELVAIIDISGNSTMNKDQPIRICCQLQEPDKRTHTLFDEPVTALPYHRETPKRYYALKGEYILGVTLYDPTSFNPDPESNPRIEEAGNRRLMANEALSQDYWIVYGLIIFAAGAFALTNLCGKN